MLRPAVVPLPPIGRAHRKRTVPCSRRETRLPSLAARAIAPATLLGSCSAHAAVLRSNDFDGQALGALSGPSALVRGETGVLTDAIAAIGQ